MANSTPKVLARTAASTSSTTLYTVPSSTNTVVTDIVVANTSGSSQTVTIALDSIVAIPAVTINANSVVNFQFKQVLATTKTITGFASATSVNIHISGVEIA